MMRSAALAVLLLLAGCGGEQSGEAVESSEAAGVMPAETATTDAAAVTPGAPPPPLQARAAPSPPGAPPERGGAPAQPGRAGPPLGTPLLAYSYEYAVKAPAQGVRSLLRRHEAACQAAGPLTCQVVDAKVEQHGRQDVGAVLTFRAAPTYVRTFRAGLDSQVQSARGRVESFNTDTEDLTRSIVDTEARLRAGRLLRDRLEALIASRPGNLAQLLEIERELARVQGEIDAAESTLAVMRARVATSTVTLNYASGGVVVDPGDTAPLAVAVDQIGANLANSLATLLNVVSILLPWLLLFGGIAWVVRLMQRRQARQPAKPSPQPADFGGRDAAPPPA